MRKCCTTNEWLFECCKIEKHFTSNCWHKQDPKRDSSGNLAPVSFFSFFVGSCSHHSIPELKIQNVVVTSQYLSLSLSQQYCNMNKYEICILTRMPNRQVSMVLLHGHILFLVLYVENAPFENHKGVNQQQQHQQPTSRAKKKIYNRNLRSY